MTRNHPYHVTARCTNKEFFPFPLSEVWPIMMEELDISIAKHFLRVHAFVLMGNHFHLLCQTPQGNLDVIIQSFMRRTSIRMKSKSSKINHLWEGPYHRSLIKSGPHYFQVYRYIYQNPLRAGLVSEVQMYPYSTLREVPFFLHSYISMSFAGLEGELLWLNEKYKCDEEYLIKKGLKKGVFEIRSSRWFQ